MKKKINIFTFSLFAWCISLALNIVKSYNIYQKDGYTTSFAAGVALMIIIWFGLLLLIMDVIHPISKHMLKKEMSKQKLVSFIGLLISDVMLLVLVFLIAFMFSNNTFLLLSFVLFTFGRTTVRRSFYAK